MAKGKARLELFCWPQTSLHSLNKIIKTLIYIVLINKGLLLNALFRPSLGRANFFSGFSPKKNIQAR
jgi:hypothetical protein